MPATGEKKKVVLGSRETAGPAQEDDEENAMAIAVWQVQSDLHSDMLANEKWLYCIYSA